uniref:Uncharacterized protein n=1 Tax=Rhizophora mucronata TaxID=61149 RepID=A0A2P2MXZ9_RHIMU
MAKMSYQYTCLISSMKLHLSLCKALCY